MKPSYLLALALLCGCSPVERNERLPLDGYVAASTNDPDWAHYHKGVDRSEMPEGYKLLSDGKKWNYQVGLWEGLFDLDTRAQAIAAAWKYCDDDLQNRKHPMVEVK